MTFEEEFPSLKYPDYVEPLEHTGGHLHYYLEGRLLNHCLDKHLHHWKVGQLYITERHQAAVEGLLGVMDAFSKTQEEFDKWIHFFNSMIIAYDEDAARLSDFKNDIRTPDVKEELVEENQFAGGKYNDI